MKKSVACIVLSNGKIFIAHRNPTGAMGDRWEFPGGKVEDGESETEAIKREMREEFGVEATVGEKVTHDHFEHNGKMNLLEAYFVSFDHDGIERKYNLTEHTEYKWVDLCEVEKYNFVDSDAKIWKKVRECIK